MASSTNLTPTERSLRGRLGALTSWANTEDRTARTKPGTDAFNARFEREVDPDGVLDPDERAKRAEFARRAHMTRLAFASAKARRRRADGGDSVAPARARG